MAVIAAGVDSGRWTALAVVAAHSVLTLARSVPNKRCAGALHDHATASCLAFVPFEIPPGIGGILERTNVKLACGILSVVSTL